MNKIPFVKPVTLGSFRLWRSKLDGMECINISTVDSSWSVRIMATFQTYSLINESYSIITDEEEDKEKRDKHRLFLTTMFDNMFFASVTGNGFYHQALMMVASIYASPDVLEDRKKRKAITQDAEKLMKAFLEWRKQYGPQVPDREEDEKILREDGTAEEMMEELAKE